MSPVTTITNPYNENISLILRWEKGRFQSIPESEQATLEPGTGYFVNSLIDQDYP